MSTQTLTGQLSELTGEYLIDPAHSRLGFAARHAMVATVRGSFTKFEGRLHIDATEPARSTAEIDIDAASIDTGHPDRDAHLRSPEFLDVQRFPALRFRSTGAEKVAEDTYRMTGELTVRDVTRPTTLDLVYQGASNDPWGHLRLGFEGSATLSRKDWGLTWNVALEAGGVLVGDKVRLELDLSLLRQA